MCTVQAAKAFSRSMTSSSGVFGALVDPRSFCELLPSQLLGAVEAGNLSRCSFFQTTTIARAILRFQAALSAQSCLQKVK